MAGETEYSDQIVAGDEPAAAAAEEAAPATLDPRVLLATWANGQDEWVRSIVGEVIQGGVALTDAQIHEAYRLFRQEKALDERTLPTVEPLAVDATVDETAPPLTITRLSDVQGVNALVPGAVIEPHVGLTIIYGENGTGKTGYARIFKALAEPHRRRHPRRHCR